MIPEMLCQARLQGCLEWRLCALGTRKRQFIFPKEIAVVVEQIQKETPVLFFLPAPVARLRRRLGDVTKQDCIDVEFPSHSLRKGRTT